MKTQNPIWQRLSKVWIQVFAVVFGIGVVSGIVMSFQFGTNWSNFSYATANFLGPVLSYEVITAFFLEAAFLGVLLFGRDKVPQGVHLFAAIMVATGTIILESAVGQVLRRRKKSLDQGMNCDKWLFPL